MRIPDIWSIHLSPWVIQDGNYGDFAKGQTAEFAVEFWIPEGSEVTQCEDPPGAKAVGHEYDAIGRCILQNAEVTLLDIGICVYRQESPCTSSAPFESGQVFRTRISLGVEPFSWFAAELANGVVQPMVYTWRIESILRQTAPLILVGRTLVRDAERLGYEEIDGTNAWEDDGGHAEYVLRCELLPVPAKITSVTALP